MISQRELAEADRHALLARPVYTEEWSWASQRASNPYPVPVAPIVNQNEDRSTPHPQPILPTSIQLSLDESATIQDPNAFMQGVQSVQSNLNDIDEGIYSTSLSNHIHGMITALPVLGTETSIPVYSTQTPIQTSVNTRSDEEVPLPITVTPPNTDLMAAMIKLGIPFTDCALLESPPMAHTVAQRTLSGAVGVGAFLGRKLLGCMYEMLRVTVHVENQLESNTNMNSNHPQLSASSTTSASTLPSQVIETRQTLLLFNEISEAERTLFLEEFLVSNGSRPFSENEIYRIKCLPLFTVRTKVSCATSLPLSLPLPFLSSPPPSSSSSRPVSISDCSGGAYWCDNSSVLDGIVYPSSTQGHSYLLKNLLVYWPYYFFLCNTSILRCSVVQKFI